MNMIIPDWAVEGDVLQYSDGTLNLWYLHNGKLQPLRIKARSVNSMGVVAKYDLNKGSSNG